MCRDNDVELELPLMERVFNGNLSLQDYKLTSKHCKSLAECVHFLKDPLKRLQLENVGITDKDFAVILTSLQEVKDFKAIVYAKNTFDKYSLEALVPFLERKVPD